MKRKSFYCNDGINVLKDFFPKDEVDYDSNLSTTLGLIKFSYHDKFFTLKYSSRTDTQNKNYLFNNYNVLKSFDGEFNIPKVKALGKTKHYYGYVLPFFEGEEINKVSDDEISYLEKITLELHKRGYAQLDLDPEDLIRTKTGIRLFDFSHVVNKDRNEMLYTMMAIADYKNIEFMKRTHELPHD